MIDILVGEVCVKYDTHDHNPDNTYDVEANAYSLLKKKWKGKGINSKENENKMVDVKEIKT